MTSEVVVQPEALWKLTEDLEALEETLPMVEARVSSAIPGDEEPGQELTEILGQMDRICMALVKKTDACAAVLRKFDSDEELIKAEEKRLKAKRQSNEKAKDRLEQYIMRVMKERGVSMFKTPLNTISIRKNGGVAPLQVTENLELLPEEMRLVTIKIPVDALSWKVGSSWASWVVDMHGKIVGLEPNNAGLREALRQPCEHCSGAGNLCPAGTNDAPLEACPRCGGTGTRQIPGAKLLERGERLEVR